jgi:hypothetical protein
MNMNSELVKRYQIAFTLGKWLASFIQLVDEMPLRIEVDNEAAASTE